MMSSGHITMGWGNMGKQLSIYSPKEHLAWRRLSDLVPWLLPWGKKAKNITTPKGLMLGHQFWISSESSNCLGSRLDVVVGHVRHQCFLLRIAASLQDPSSRECHEWGLWRLHLSIESEVKDLDVKISWLKTLKFSLLSWRNFWGITIVLWRNVTIEWEGEFGRDVHQNHAELVLKKCFLKRRLLTKKKEVKQYTPEVKIALEKRWLEDYFPVGSRELFRVYVKLRGGGGVTTFKKVSSDILFTFFFQSWEINEKITSTMPMLELITQLHIIIRMEEMRYELRKI